ncbi:activator of Hsp90 ATPase-like protein [Glaciihabitans tibetensis]|uniref:Activator of Hsp90 ATPase-like protein n=1 Tax=Glaciihabitans tibetensis TaxID=1266600 RepID=A0A2T0VBI5_9MICO|nr:SRPBCC domain-containing protein [Glaciihabitans tibetensis]PRY67524.1 activator of Hsp90 ATPase-like protein [Glaciihabitans tibetensis]
MNNTNGQTKDAGWDVGVRKTVDAPLDVVWVFLLGKGLDIWLGNTRLSLEKGARYETDDDISGHIISVSDKSRIRMTWQPGEWDHDSVLHVTVKTTPIGTTIGFEQERLANRDERKIMLTHWKEVLDRLQHGLLEVTKRS